MPQLDCRLGIDVGGTNTDAVLMDGMRVLADVKTGTTADVTSGIVTGLRSLVDQSGDPEWARCFEDHPGKFFDAHSLYTSAAKTSMTYSRLRLRRSNCHQLHTPRRFASFTINAGSRSP